MEIDDRTHTRCCPQAIASQAVFLFIDEYRDDLHDPAKPVLPEWCMCTSSMVDLSGTSTYYESDGKGGKVTKTRFCKHDPEWMHSHVAVKFCPFCGQKVPEIKLRKNPPSLVRKITDGGYYCDTCHERLHACMCHPLDHLWEIG